MQAALHATLTRVRDAFAWRIRQLAGDQRVDRFIVGIARRWRPMLRKPVFIGIAGSAGKTTTKELLLAVLGDGRLGTANPGSLNKLPEVAKTILRVRPAHDFCIAELSEDAPGVLDEPLALLQPRIGIVTVVGNDHWSAFASRDAIASEIRKLIASLPATGVAVINHDDEHVRAMAATCAARVITYGASPDAELSAKAVRAAWPDRLELTLVHHSREVNVSTRLCGAHWVPSVLAAVAGGLAAGMSLDECAAGLGRAPPYEGRMQPVSMPDGVTFIRDDYKAPLWTVESCLEFVRSARARRKIVVIGTMSDCGAGAPEKYIKVAKRAQEVADLTLFVGPWASQVLKARRPGNEDALRVFRNVRDAARYLEQNARDGDLILLKGTNKQDHLQRIILARTDGVACWRDDCDRYLFCTACPDRNKPSGLPVLMADGSGSLAAPEAALPGPGTIGDDVQVVVGLGNPEARYARTPHNVGYEVVETLADSWGLAWQASPAASIARGSINGQEVCLVKLPTAMNLTGAGLKRLADQMAFGVGQCVLVHDDLDMPLGSVRIRLSGGAGGHRGVASILEAFQTDAFRRIKVGVGQPGAKVNRVEYVLTAFDPASRAAIEPAISAAAARTIEVVGKHAALERH